MGTAGARRRARHVRGGVPAPFDRPHRGVDGRAAGGWRLRPPGPGVSAGAARADDCRCADAVAAHRWRVPPDRRRRRVSPDRPGGRAGPVDDHAPTAGAGGGRARRARLRDLHVGIHWTAEGRADFASRRAELPRLDAPDSGPARRRPPARRDDSVVRHRRAGGVAAIDDRRHGRARRTRRRVGRPRARPSDRLGADHRDAGDPATWRLLQEAGWTNPGGIRVLVGGEALPLDLARDLRRVSRSVWNLYGPTETTIWSAVEPVEAVEGPVPIGRPIGNTRLYVLNERLEPLPPGVVGDLYIGGDGLARGYLGQPDMRPTASFRIRMGAIPVRACTVPATGRPSRTTGAWCSSDGRPQVKLRGYRIEPGDVEAALGGATPAVRQAVVDARSVGSGTPVLVAYYVLPGRRAAHGRRTCASTCAASLPEYMVPSHRRPARPACRSTPNGKVDRKALPDVRRRAGPPPGAAHGPAAHAGRTAARPQDPVPRCCTPTGIGVARRLLRDRRPLAARAADAQQGGGRARGRRPAGPDDRGLDGRGPRRRRRVDARRGPGRRLRGAAHRGVARGPRRAGRLAGRRLPGPPGRP